MSGARKHLAFLTAFVLGFIALAIAPITNAQKTAPAAQTITISAEGDYTLGSPKAKVVLVEYGAPTCPYCKSWHDAVYVKLKRDYVDAGRIRFAFRELPSHNPPIDAAIFGLARCAAQDKYFAVLDAAFARQADIEASNRQPSGPLPLLKKLAGDFGITPDRFMGPCLTSAALKTRLAAVQQLAIRDKVEGTPTLVLNGQLVPDAAMDDYAALRALIDKAIAAAR